MSTGVDRDNEVEEIELGYDRFEAMTIAESCRAVGVDVQLRLMDQNGIAPGRLALTRHRLLYHHADRIVVGKIVDDSGSSKEQKQVAPSGTAIGMKAQLRRTALRLAGLLILMTMFLPAVVSLIFRHL